MNQTRLAGVGGLAFGILAFVALIVASPPGGNYKASDVTSFLAKGHRPAVFISVYLMLIAVAGLLLLLARLRTTIEGSRGSLFWAFSVASATAWFAGYLLVAGPSTALAFSGGIGAHAPQIRTRICAGLGFLGVELDEAANCSAGERISASWSATSVLALATDEEVVIAGHCRSSAADPAEAVTRDRG